MAGVGVQYPSCQQRETFETFFLQNPTNKTKKTYGKKSTILKQSVVKKKHQKILKKSNKLQTKCCKKKFKTNLKPKNYEEKKQNSNKLQTKCCQKKFKKKIKTTKKLFIKTYKTATNYNQNVVKKSLKKQAFIKLLEKLSKQKTKTRKKQQTTNQLL